MRIELHPGDNIPSLQRLPRESVDAVVTDPPYGLGTPPDPLDMLRAWTTSGRMDIRGRGFVGCKWDAFVPQPAFWREVFRVMKPGAILVAFFGTRTYDVGTLAIRLAGFEIRDQLAWIYGQGFPKNANSLKPAQEPIVLARKPGASRPLGIDACRISGEPIPSFAGSGEGRIPRKPGSNFRMGRSEGCILSSEGRWPANVVHDGSPEVMALFPDTKSGKPGTMRLGVNRGAALGKESRPPGTPMTGFGDEGSAARFFYCAKASPSERAGSKHPTVKPVALMRWLADLVTPPGGVVLDPFAGTGTLGAALADRPGRCILMEREPEYVAGIARRLRLRPLPGTFGLLDRRLISAFHGGESRGV